MGSVINYYKCPQCGGIVYNDWYYTAGEEYENCSRCGRWAEIRHPENDEERKLVDKSGLLHRSGMGYGRCSIMSVNGVGRSFSLSEPYSEEIEKWYMDAMKDENVDSEGSYLTRWDEEIEQLIVVHGKDPGLYDDYETEVDEECSSAEDTAS